MEALSSIHFDLVRPFEWILFGSRICLDAGVAKPGKAHALRACGPSGLEGSNPSPGAYGVEAPSPQAFARAVPAPCVDPERARLSLKDTGGTCG